MTNSSIRVEFRMDVVVGCSWAIAASSAAAQDTLEGQLQLTKVDRHGAVCQFFLTRRS